jgi:hypothetical protein
LVISSPNRSSKSLTDNARTGEAALVDMGKWQTGQAVPFVAAALGVSDWLSTVQSVPQFVHQTLRS